MSSTSTTVELTLEQLIIAVEEMKFLCNAKMVGYQMVSARGALVELGYEGDAVEQILRAIADAGFTYCLDHTIAANPGEFPSQDVCHWGPDQLKSRLDALWRLRS